MHGGDGRACLDRRDGAGDLCYVGASDNSVDTGQHPEHTVTVTLRQAAGHKNGAKAPLTLEFEAAPDDVGRLLHRRSDEGACVDDGEFGAVGTGDERVACLIEQAEHDLGVNQVFRASERYEGDLHAVSGRVGHEPRSPWSYGDPLWTLAPGGGASWNSPSGMTGPISVLSMT